MTVENVLIQICVISYYLARYRLFTRLLFSLSYLLKPFYLDTIHNNKMSETNNQILELRQTTIKTRNFPHDPLICFHPFFHKLKIDGRWESIWTNNMCWSEISECYGATTLVIMFLHHLPAETFSLFSKQGAVLYPWKFGDKIFLCLPWSSLQKW